MGRIIAICGKICCGKSYYSNKLKEKENAVILSCDELTSVLFNNNLGEKHDEIVNVNINVILDWGFWSKQDRQYIKDYFYSKNIDCEFHYINIDNKSWHGNIEERNQRVLEDKGGSDYYLDDGLMKKLLSKWEEPSKEEIDVWYTLER